MCLGIPGQVVEFTDTERHFARVDVGGVRRVINVGLLIPDGLKPGDWVLIHVGFALSLIDEAEARRTMEFLKELGDTYEQELDQIASSELD